MPLNVSFDYRFKELPPLADGADKSTVKLTSYLQNDKRRISMQPKDCSAVEVRRLRYAVGRATKAKVILSGINMTVPEGAIYGLLGPSGSGKTTLLRSVVGQLTPSEGWIKVFGFQPNQPGSQIPGSAIGYMPQELAVYEDFSIQETLWYFGRLYRVPRALIKERIEFLVSFLDLPRSKRLVANMSGGQKRRVSLASALVHAPPLLILDEPTVGVDPLLRQSIWQHLVTLTQTEKITVIVTTHYIEEARRANIVGLMRRGRLLAENAPDELMQRHESTSLEDVFLKLCVSDTMRRAAKLASLTSLPEQEASALPTPELMVRRRGQQPPEDRLSTQESATTSEQSPEEKCGGLKRVSRQLRSLFRLAEPNSSSGSSSTSKQTDEKRRQSGSHFIEQLMSQCQQQQKQPSSRPLDELLSCDINNNRLKVPQVSVIDSGAVSDASSQHHSPASLSGYLNPAFQHQASTENISSTGGQCLALTPEPSGDELVVEFDPSLFINPADLGTMSPGNKYAYKTQSASEYCDTIKTITWKNYIRLKRNVPLLLFQFLLPAIQVILFCICVGNDPFDIPVAIVNEESSNDSLAAMSSQFLRSLDQRLVRQISFASLEPAIESVRAGKNWGVLHIPENFTVSVHKRFAGLEMELDRETLENSTIKVYPDMTNQPIGHAMEVAFRRAYSELSRQTFNFLGLNPALSDPPIRMETAIYGKLDMQNYLQYMSPGVLISISYIMATGLTSLAFIIERRDGLYDRTLAAGVDHVQMLLSHSIVQLLVMIVQISLVVFFTFVIYKVPTNGPFVWVFLLLLLQGLAGMMFGLMVSAICREENTAIMMILGTFYPNLLLAGVIWPIEAIPHWLRWFSYLQPQTLPTQSLRDLIVRGWNIDQPGVWSGFAVTSIWLILFLIISCIAFRIRK